LDKKDIKLFNRELLNQIKNVLRLGMGSKISLSDGSGREAVAQITTFGKDFVGLELQEALKNDNESGRYLILYCSVLKRENFEWVIQKATEVGVKEIFPIITERTVKFNVKMERLEKIAREAAEQSGRSFVPKVYEPIRLFQAIEHSKKNDLNWFFDISGQPIKKSLPVVKNKIGVFIGPEGGWTSKEISGAKSSRLKLVSLGRLTLRAETAAVVASYLAASL